MSIPIIIAGPGKSGTTALFRGMQSSGLIRSGIPKEPQYFLSRKSKKSVHRAVKIAQKEGYRFADCSVIYADPKYCEVAAENARAYLTDAKIIFVIRERYARVASHLNHDLLKGRISRSELLSCTDPNIRYFRGSLYAPAIFACSRRVGGDNVAVIDYDSLFSPDFRFWYELLDFLDAPQPRTGLRLHNQTASKPVISRRARILFSVQSSLGLPSDVAPKWLRLAIKRALGVSTSTVSEMMVESKDVNELAIAPQLQAAFEVDEELLQRMYAIGVFRGFGKFEAASAGKYLSY